MPYLSLGNYAKAIEYHEQTLVIARELKDERAEMTALNAIRGTCQAQQEALATKDRPKNCQLADLLLTQGRTREAQSIFIDHRDEAYLLLLQGIQQVNTNQYEAALQSFGQALTLYRNRSDRNGEASALVNLGVAYVSLSQYEKGIACYMQARPIYQQINDPNGEAAMLMNLGVAYVSLSQYEKGIAYYEQAQPLYRQVNDRRGEAEVLMDLGNAYGSLSQYEKAIAYYEQARPIFQQLKDRSGEAGVLVNLGTVYIFLFQHEKAIAYYEQARPIFQQLKDRHTEAVLQMKLGFTYASLSKYEKAIAYYEQALPILQQVKDPEALGGLFSNLGDLFARRNDPELAIVFFKQSVNAYESIRQDIRKLPRETQEIYTSSVAKTYRALADLLLTQGRTREAQAILELLKVQELRGYGKDQETNASPVQFPFHPLESQALQAFEQTIAAKSLSLETLTALAQPLGQNRDRIVQESNNTPSAIGNSQAVLQANPNSLLIQNLVVGDKLWVIWTNASGKTTAIVVSNVSQKQLSATVDQFRKQIGSPYSDLDQLKATSNQLYNWLIPPQLQAELAKNPQQHLIFSLDHVTRYIPVAVLFDGNQYLSQRYILSNLITTASDTTDRLSLPGQAPTILALGTSKAFPGFNPLPNVPAELSAIVHDGNDKGIYPGKIRLDAAFTANSLRDNRAPFRVLHIATHGSFNPKTITASFLLLGDGNHLPITDIATLTTIHLVVLSACETGLSGSAQDGTEISGISGYFLYRGAKAVIASLWSVNDASTALLMQQFYKNLATGKMSKAEALRQVQLDFIQGKLTAKQADSLSRAGARRYIGGQPPIDSFAHPYYWAPFILIGNSL